MRTHLLLFVTIALLFFLLGCSLLGLFPQKSRSTPPAPVVTRRFICPKGEWLDCMPSPDAKNSFCSKDYIDWALKNCEGFKGVAY